MEITHMRFERVISTIDAHAAGEPLRIITAGLPPLPGATVLERRRYMAEHHTTSVARCSSSHAAMPTCTARC